MKIKDVQPQSYVKTLQCDRCNLEAEVEESEFYEFTSIEFTAGYGSIFGDGNSIELDICQQCLKETLGQYLKISEPQPIPNKLCSSSLFDNYDDFIDDNFNDI
jgi:hypothetical protein